MKGKFVVIEGLEGAGKSSAIANVITHLQAKGIEQAVREPGGTVVSRYATWSRKSGMKP